MKNISIGQKVVNFGFTATVVGFHPVSGDPILQGESGMRWIADPEKCENPVA